MEITDKFFAGCRKTLFDQGDYARIDNWRMGLQNDDLAVYLGRRSKKLTIDDWTESGGGAILDGERKGSMAAGRGDDALSDFFLDEKNDFEGGIRRREEFFDDRRGDVIGGYWQLQHRDWVRFGGQIGENRHE